MDNNYTFERFEKELDEGYQMFYTYVRNRYLLFKTAENCYTPKLISEYDKNPQPRHIVVTHKRIEEMFPFMEDIEYRIGI